MFISLGNVASFEQCVQIIGFTVNKQIRRIHFRYSVSYSYHQRLAQRKQTNMAAFFREKSSSSVHKRNFCHKNTAGDSSYCLARPRGRCVQLKHDGLGFASVLGTGFMFDISIFHCSVSLRISITRINNLT